MKGYTTVNLVAKEMAQDLTAPQLDQCADLIEAAEHEVDRETGRTWLTTTPVSSELHTVNGPVVYLKNRPVVAVSSVTIRSTLVGQDPVTQTVDEQYELIDAVGGILLLAGYGYPHDVVINTEYTHHNGWLLSVNYTHSLTVIEPAIQKITTELVAAWMSSIVGSDLSDVKSFEVPDLLSVTYRDNPAGSLAVPTGILRRLRLFERVLIA
jgi:hypothetical protein